MDTRHGLKVVTIGEVVNWSIGELVNHVATIQDIEQLRYPAGPMPRSSAPLDARTREEYLAILEATPARIRSLVSGLSDQQLDTPYRPGGWTVRQVVHHVPDSHLNAYIRIRLALTEATPTIKPYEEARWAELPDARTAPIDISLALLEALHARWDL